MKILFEKLFTEQDEITVLKGIHDYITKYGGKDPLNDIDEFFHLINDSLQCEANPTKMKDKIKRMNKKYLKNSIKNRNNGTEPNFKKPYDQRLKLSPPTESSSDDELMPLPKPTTLFEPYDDDTTNSHSEEEYDDPKPQKPSSNSKKKESHDEPPKSNSEKLVHSSTTKHPPDDDEICESSSVG
ncbi:hypothetical protein ACFE04_021360 [Oxalis oulophora]